MAIEKEDYLKLKRYYKGYFLNEFDEDYYNYRAVIRLINSYFKNPHYKKTHDIYNRIIILHRVFDNKFINIELLNTCDDDFKKSYLKYVLNELFEGNYRLKFFEDKWENDICIIRDNNVLCRKST